MAGRRGVESFARRGAETQILRGADRPVSIEELHTIVFYEYVPDIVQRRGPHRDAHLAWLQKWRSDGQLIAAGAVGDPPSGAILLLRADADADALREGDPYVKAGLVSSWRVEPWRVAVR